MSANDDESFRRLGAAFSTGGERYDRLRPGYPNEALSWLVEGTPVHGTVVDVGAGTGKLTAGLASMGFTVVAVDPSSDMLDEVPRLLPGVSTRVGSGETTGLPDDTADLVTFAQSWRWVEPTAGSAETSRILKPGGRAAWVWNFMDVRQPWAAELAGIWHTLAGDEATDATRHQPVLGAPFGPVESMTVDWEQPMLLVDLAELVTTRSYYLNASESQQQQIKVQVAAFLTAEFADLTTVDVPYRTHCFRARTGPADGQVG